MVFMSAYRGRIVEHTPATITFLRIWEDMFERNVVLRLRKGDFVGLIWCVCKGLMLCIVMIQNILMGQRGYLIVSNSKADRID